MFFITDPKLSLPGHTLSYYPHKSNEGVWVVLESTLDINTPQSILLYNYS